MKEKEEKNKGGRPNKYKEGVKTSKIYNTEVPEEKAQEIKDFIKKVCAPYLRG